MKFKDMKPGEFGCAKMQHHGHEEYLAFVKTDEINYWPVTPTHPYDDISVKVLVNAVDLDTGQTLRIDDGKDVMLINKQPLIKALGK